MLDWSLTVHQTGEPFVVDRQVDIYFGPELINNLEVMCLELEFMAFRYFAVKLVYLLGSEYTETLVFRSMTQLSQSFRVLTTNVNPEMTERQPFYIVLHLRSHKPGRMAVIRRFKLLPYKCNQKGKTTVSIHMHTTYLCEV